MTQPLTEHCGLGISKYRRTSWQSEKQKSLKGAKTPESGAEAGGAAGLESMGARGGARSEPLRQAPRAEWERTALASSVASGHHVESPSCEWYSLDCVLAWRTGCGLAGGLGSPWSSAGFPRVRWRQDPGRQWREGWVWAWSREELLGGEEGGGGTGVLSAGIGGWRVTAGSAVASGRKRAAEGRELSGGHV